MPRSASSSGRRERFAEPSSPRGGRARTGPSPRSAPTSTRSAGARRRQPIWPDGVTGSISHAAGSRPRWRPTSTVRSHRSGSMSKRPRAGTRALVAGADDIGESPFVVRLGTRPLPATAVFSAKEAAFKAVFPLWNAEVEFLDAHTQIHGDTWQVEIPEPRRGESPSVRTRPTLWSCPSRSSPRRRDRAPQAVRWSGLGRRAIPRSSPTRSACCSTLNLRRSRTIPAPITAAPSASRWVCRPPPDLTRWRHDPESSLHHGGRIGGQHGQSGGRTCADRWIPRCSARIISAKSSRDGGPRSGSESDGPFRRRCVRVDLGLSQHLFRRGIPRDSVCTVRPRCAGRSASPCSCTTPRACDVGYRSRPSASGASCIATLSFGAQ